MGWLEQAQGVVGGYFLVTDKVSMYMFALSGFTFFQQCMEHHTLHRYQDKVGPGQSTSSVIPLAKVGNRLVL